MGRLVPLHHPSELPHSKFNRLSIFAAENQKEQRNCAAPFSLQPLARLLDLDRGASGFELFLHLQPAAPSLPVEAMTPAPEAVSHLSSRLQGSGDQQHARRFGHGIALDNADFYAMP